MLQLNQLPEHLATLKKQDWAKLFSLREMTNKNKEAENELATPFTEDPDIVQVFLVTVYELGIIINFDWMAWKEGENMLENKHQDFNSIDMISLCMLITRIVRMDRFSDGYIAYCFETGIISKILQALKSKVIASS
jgi:hypothetical protein